MGKVDLTFEDKVAKCRKNESPDLIQNAAWDHAVFLFKNLLQVASEKKESVRLVTGHLNDKFYSELSDELDECMEAEVLVELIVLDSMSDLDSNSFYNKVSDYEKGHVFVSPEGVHMGAPHMLLIGDDGKRFRLEVDHDQTKAVASFNNAGMGDSLRQMYDEIKSRMESLAPQPREAASAV